MCSIGHTHTSARVYTHFNYKTVCTNACKTHDTIPVHTCLPEDEPSVSKHVEDIKM